MVVETHPVSAPVRVRHFYAIFQRGQPRRLYFTLAYTPISVRIRQDADPDVSYNCAITFCPLNQQFCYKTGRDAVLDAFKNGRTFFVCREVTDTQPLELLAFRALQACALETQVALGVPLRLVRMWNPKPKKEPPATDPRADQFRRERREKRADRSREIRHRYTEWVKTGSKEGAIKFLRQVYGHRG